VAQLQYYYSGKNSLDSVKDNNASNAGLVSGITRYTYDGNGNMLTAANTANTGQNKSFTYNILNLPNVVTVPNGTDTYTYDAEGNKLRRVSVIGGVTKTTDYIGGIEYDNSSTAIGFMQTEEGKAVPNGTTNYDYNCYLGDNLGNTRVTFGAKTAAAVVYQQDDYYPFGLEILRTSPIPNPKNEYLYNKKELQEDFTDYDYGARFYDPVIVRWGVVDTYAEHPDQVDLSPYVYVADNPINTEDPDGNCPPCDVPDDSPGVLSVAGNFLGGIGQSVIGTVTGAVHAVLHPVETVTGLASLANPVTAAVNGTLAVMKIEGQWKNGNADVKANMIGNGVGDVAQLFIGTEEIKATTEALKITQGADAANILAKTDKVFVPADEGGNALKTVKTKAGNTKIDAEGRGVAHTQLREDASGNYAQRTTFDSKGRKRADTHFTTHGEPKKTNPHKHTYYKNGKRAPQSGS